MLTNGTEKEIIMARSFMLSIDWDFFIWNGLEAKGLPKITACPGTAQEQHISAFHLFDWGHNEAHGGLLMDLLWASRFEAFHRIGLDMEQEAAICSDRGCVEPKEFMEVIHKRFDLQGANVWFADSHSWGCLTAQEASSCAGGPINLVHFDAHCDLGYNKKALVVEQKNNTCDCASWLWHALNHNYVGNVLLV